MSLPGLAPMICQVKLAYSACLYHYLKVKPMSQSSEKAGRFKNEDNGEKTSKTYFNKFSTHLGHCVI